MLWYNGAMETTGAQITETLSELVAFEREQVRYHTLPPDGQSGIAVVRGRRPVLITAPHGTAHVRRGRWKTEEEYTSAVAWWLARQTGAWVMYVTHALDPDPHADRDDSPFKMLMADVLAGNAIRLVVDLHGVRGDRDFALALGTINGSSCPTYEPCIVRALEAEGFARSDSAPSLRRLVLNHPRYAGGVYRQTVTRFASEQCGVEAAQLEINAWLRVVQRLEAATYHREAPHFRGEPAHIWRLLKALGAVIAAVD